MSNTTGPTRLFHPSTYTWLAQRLWLTFSWKINSFRTTSEISCRSCWYQWTWRKCKDERHTSIWARLGGIWMCWGESFPSDIRSYVLWVCGVIDHFHTSYPFLCSDPFDPKPPPSTHPLSHTHIILPFFRSHISPIAIKGCWFSHISFFRHRIHYDLQWQAKRYGVKERPNFSGVRWKARFVWKSQPPILGSVL